MTTAGQRREDIEDPERSAPIHHLDRLMGSVCNARSASASVETRYGPGLKESVITEAGDFLFIPPDVPHQPTNLSTAETARAIPVRNDPDEQELVILYDPSGHD